MKKADEANRGRVPGDGEGPGVVPGAFGEVPSTVQVEFGARSRPGKSRSVNTDHYAVIRLGRHQETVMTSLPAKLLGKRFDEHGYAMVVADGFGSAAIGEEASRLAIATLMHLAIHFGKWNLRIDDAVVAEIMARAERFYRYVDSTLAHKSHMDPAAGLQTTLTATFGAGRDLFFAHVGHSRAYLLRDGQLARLTRDHTIAAHSMIRAGLLVDLNASARDLKHIVTNTIGMPGTHGPAIDLERILLDDGDRVLVCTNGLTDMVDEHELAAVLASPHSPDDQAGALVDLAVAAGGEDDVTAVIAAFHIPASFSTDGP